MNTLPLQRSPIEGTERANRLLCLALDIGEGMVRCGAEINRVEDTVTRICRAYDASHVEIFAISSLIIASVRMKDGEYSSQMRRIDETTHNLDRLTRFNAISRTICATTPSLDEFDRMIHEAKKAPTYPAWLRTLAAALSAAAFAVMFGGDPMDGIIAAFAGALIYLIDLVPFHQINRLAKTVIQSFVGGLIACLSVRLGIGHDQGMIMIGTIMVIVPGVSFGTAFRDLLCGDILAGSLKTVQCILAASMIAAGYLLAMFAMGGAA